MICAAASGAGPRAWGGDCQIVDGRVGPWDACDSILASWPASDVADICGADIGSVLRSVGWMPTQRAQTTLVMAGDVPIAFAWCMPTRADAGRAPGMNFTYVVHQDHRGQGWASVAAAGAFLQVCLAYPDQAPKWDWLNIQCAAHNTASAGVATRLGFTRCVERDFTVAVPGNKHRDYLGFRSSFLAFVDRAERVLSDFDSRCARAPMLLERERQE